MAAVETAKEHIRAGDIFQVVLSHRMSAAVSQPAVRGLPRAARSRTLRRTCTTCVSATSRSSAARPRCSCAAPTATLEVRPIAGTRPRGRSADEDRALEEELLAVREGARRARDARGPRAQRRRARRGVRHGRDQRVHGRRALLAGHAPGLERARPREGRPAAARRRARHVSRRDRERCPQGARDGDHRCARARAARHLRGRGRALRLPRQPRPRHRHPHARLRERPRLLGRRRGHRRRLRPGSASGRRP